MVANYRIILNEEAATEVTFNVITLQSFTLRQRFKQRHAEPWELMVLHLSVLEDFFNEITIHIIIKNNKRNICTGHTHSRIFVVVLKEDTSSVWYLWGSGINAAQCTTRQPQAAKHFEITHVLPIISRVQSAA